MSSSIFLSALLKSALSGLLCALFFWALDDTLGRWLGFEGAPSGQVFCIAFAGAWTASFLLKDL